jgi:hypothetical protein
MLDFEALFISLSLGVSECIFYCIGKVILGSSFKSGDVHAFFYGPHAYPDSSFTTLSGFEGRGQMENLESISNISSWQFPVKLKSPKLNMKSNIERNFATVPLPFEFYTPVSQMHPLFGVFSFSPIHDMRKFTILQLTGKGCITSQNYEISEELDSRNFYKRAIGFQQTLAITQSGKSTISLYECKKNNFSTKVNFIAKA